MKSVLTKAQRLITYPFRMIYDFFQFSMELDREIADNRSKRDAWVDESMKAEQKKAQTNSLGQTEHFESFTCNQNQINEYLLVFQGQKEKFGFQKVKVDAMASQSETKVTVIVRYFSPIPRDAT